MSGSMSTSPATSQVMDHNLVDSLLDFSEYENYQSPSLSPANKTPFARPIKTEMAGASALNGTSRMPPKQPLGGPSHQYELYKQQTGIVPGALASTLEINNNSQVQGYNSFNAMEYLGMNNSEDMFDFSSTPSQGQMPSPELDMDFENDNFFFDTINPNSMGGQEPGNNLPSPPVLSSQNNVGRIWPGMHQQAALAKAQAQQRQQQQLIQQQRQQTQQKQQAQRPKSAMPADPIVEQKITQLLNSMRAKPSSGSEQNSPIQNTPRLRKDEDDMDEDERLLASEEGKKLSSKERRQLRNKVSARAFRSRRKEYITQLEAEIASKVNENGDLKAHNRALVEENKRLSDLTRMLLSSPSFSDFLDRISTNPQAMPQAVQQATQPQQEQARQASKDVNPYAAQQQISMAMIPEQSMDFSMLNMDNAPVDSFNYQPQVYAVLETPEPTIDLSALSGKTSNFVTQFDSSDDEKVEMPVIERPVAAAEAPVECRAVDEEFENDPAFALYHAESAAPVSAERKTIDSIVEGLASISVLSEKPSCFELVDATEDQNNAVNAMARVQSISAGLEGVLARLEMMTADL